MCLNTSEEKDVFICFRKHFHLNKSEKTHVPTHVLLNIDKTNALKHIRRHVKTEMYLNTIEDTRVIRHPKKHGCA
jgi:hypothetical protein